MCGENVKNKIRKKKGMNAAVIGLQGKSLVLVRKLINRLDHRSSVPTMPSCHPMLTLSLNASFG